MIFENLTTLAVPSLDAVIKVGDTIADILEGVNAKVYSVGVILGSNEMALTEAETKSMPASELEARIADVKAVSYTHLLPASSPSPRCATTFPDT